MASAWSSCASMTQTSAPHPLYVDSGFTASDDVSTCPGKSHTSNCTNDELAMSFLTILLVASMKSVSCGLILWNTTFWIDDLPARRAPISRMRGVGALLMVPLSRVQATTEAAQARRSVKSVTKLAARWLSLRLLDRPPTAAHLSPRGARTSSR